MRKSSLETMPRGRDLAVPQRFQQQGASANPTSWSEELTRDGIVITATTIRGKGINQCRSAESVTSSCVIMVRIMTVFVSTTYTTAPPVKTKDCITIIDYSQPHKLKCLLQTYTACMYTYKLLGVIYLFVITPINICHCRFFNHK